jgi:hypothetical protein
MKKITNPMRVFMGKLKVAKNIKEDVMLNLKNLLYLDDNTLDDFEWCLMVSFFDEIVKFNEALVFVLKICDKIDYVAVTKLMLHSMYDSSADSFDIYEFNECMCEVQSVLDRSMVNNSSRDDYNTTLYNMSVLYNLKYKYAEFKEDLKPRTILELMCKVLYPLTLIYQGILVEYEDIDEILSKNQEV